jgi:hypothetical protein
MKQPIPRRLNKRIPARILTAVKGENNAAIVAVVFFPPTLVSNALVGVFVKPVVEIMIGYRNGEPVLVDGRRQTPRDSPRPEDTAFFQPQIKVGPGLAVIVQHKRGMRRLPRNLCHDALIETPSAELLEVAGGQRPKRVSSAAGSGEDATLRLGFQVWL